MNEPAPAQFELNFKPNVELISLVRRFVSEFYDRVLTDRDAVARLALATHELLENAVKYSIDGATSLSINVDRLPTGAVVSLKISNRGEADHLGAVVGFFKELDDFKNPLDHYQHVMERTLALTEGSGLGLARVRAEGEMLMTYEIEGDRVTIQASTAVGEGP
jgi:two-component sensor histidine kinase